VRWDKNNSDAIIFAEVISSEKHMTGVLVCNQKCEFLRGRLKI
jgi:hypothetical protein